MCDGWEFLIACMLNQTVLPIWIWLSNVPNASGTGLDAESVEIVARSSFLAMADSVVVVIVPTDVAGSALLATAGVADFCVSSVELAMGVEPMNMESIDLYMTLSLFVSVVSICLPQCRAHGGEKPNNSISMWRCQ